MKATGIVRRIDELGRIVIPKEIRRTLRIREGEPIEIFTDEEGQVVLRKYSQMVELAAFARQYAESLAKTTGNLVCIVDRDQVVAFAGGPKKDILSKQISSELEDMIDARQSIIASRNDRDFVPITEPDTEEYQAQAISPIICEGDAVGAVIITTKEQKAKFGDTEAKLTSSAAGFLGKQMEG